MIAKDIVSLLSKLSLPALTSEQLKEIARVEGGEFINGLYAAVNDQNQQARLYVAAITHASLPATRDALQCAGQQPTIDEILAVAKREGRMFFRALKAVEKRATCLPEALEYLAGQFAKHDQAATPNPAPAERDFSRDVAVRVYGKKAALCFSQDTTRDRGKGVKHAVRLEAALRSGPESFDWPAKIGVQLQPNELYVFLTVLYGFVATQSFSGHGDAHDKLVKVEAQAGNFYVTVAQRGQQMRAVPIAPAVACLVQNLMERQIIANDPHLDGAMIRSAVQNVANMMLRCA